MMKSYIRHARHSEDGDLLRETTANDFF